MKRKFANLVLGLIAAFDFFGIILISDVLIEQFPHQIAATIILFIIGGVVWLGYLFSDMFTWRLDEKNCR